MIEVRHEAYRPPIEDGRGIFPEDVRVKAPRGLSKALSVAAERRHTTRAEYIRQALLRNLEADGVQLRIGRLTTVGQVASELGRLYRHARWGEIPVADASRLATILAVMRQCLESSELEKRIADMEAALAPADSGSVVPFRRNRG